MASSNLQAELRDLREQMSDLKDAVSREARRSGRVISHRASDALEDASRAANSVAGYNDDMRHRASEVMHGAARTAGLVADYARDGADSVAGVVRRHPTATSTALVTLGIVGGIIGYLVATSAPAPRDRSWRWN